MKRETEEPAGEDTLRVARLAIFISTFGGVIVLGLVMICLRAPPPPVPLAQHDGIQIELIAGPSPAGVMRPRLNLRIYPPGDGEGRDLPLDLLGDGQSRPGATGDAAAAYFKPYADIKSLGLSYASEICSSACPEGEVGRVLVLPKVGGQWQFAIHYVNGATRPGVLSSPLEVKAVVFSNYGPAEGQTYAFTLRRFGDNSSTFSVDVDSATQASSISKGSP